MTSVWPVSRNDFYVFADTCTIYVQLVLYMCVLSWKALTNFRRRGVVCGRKKKRVLFTISLFITLSVFRFVGVFVGKRGALSPPLVCDRKQCNILHCRIWFDYFRVESVYRSHSVLFMVVGKIFASNLFSDWSKRTSLRVHNTILALSESIAGLFIIMLLLCSFEY